MTFVSRLACTLPLFLMLGCTQSFRLRGRHVRQVVADYEKTGQVALASGGKRYVITPAQEPRLRVHTDTCALPEGSPDVDCGYLEGHLSDFRVMGPRLRLSPDAAPRIDSIDGLELIIDGEPARPRENAAPPERESENRFASNVPKSEKRSTGDAIWKRGWRPTQLWGVQLGGSGYAQVSFRWAFVKYLHLELGMFVIGPELVANGSAGLIAELPFENGWAPYIGAGGGGGLVAGPGDPEECGKPVEECPVRSSHASTEFWYARVGIGKYIRWWNVHRVGVDVGFWRGIQTEGEPDHSEPFLWPMAGLSYHSAF